MLSANSSNTNSWARSGAIVEAVLELDMRATYAIIQDMDSPLQGSRFGGVHQLEKPGDLSGRRRLMLIAYDGS